jgi:ATP-dependent Clp endopeptidase proteolytic subunit ClpP
VKNKWFAMSEKDGAGEIHIYDEIGRWGITAMDFLKELKALGDVKSLAIHINSPGGDVFEGQAMYSLLKQHKATKTIYVDGLAASMGSIIAMAGDKIVMPENAMMMIHNPWTISVGDADDMRKAADTIEKIGHTLAAVYVARTGKSPEDIAKMMNEETWFTAAEAKEHGFADEVVEAVSVEAKFDLSKFRKVPPSAAANFAVSAGTPSTPNRPAAGEVPRKETPMEKPTNAPGNSPTQAEIDARVNAATAEAQKAERGRIAAINTTAKQLKLDAHADGKAAIEKLIADGASIEDARAKLIDTRAAIDEKTGPLNPARGGSEDTFDNPQFVVSAMSTAFASRFVSSIKVDANAPAAQFMGLGVLGLISEMLRLKGEKNIPRDPSKLAAMALHSTSDFPKLLADVGNKILLPNYAAATPTYRLIAAERRFNDFKAHKFLRVGDFPDLLQVGENGEIKRGTISENREQVTLATYARIVGVTRQMLINDDISAFTDLAALAGRRVANWENAFIYAILAQNSNLGPTLEDTHTLFKAQHNNYTASGTAVNLPVELGKSRALMRKQTGLDGLKLNLAPRYLVAGPDNETAMEQVTTQTTAQQPSNVNRVGPSLTPVVDANITGVRWMLFADPAEAPVLIYGSLPGQTGPMIETKQGWDVEGVELKVVRDFGGGAIDFRGATLNAGATPS